MMRQAAVNDYWRRVYNRDYDVQISELNLNGIGGFNKLTFRQGIFAICGLNGAGKTTILSVLKDVLGLQLNKQDEYKVKNQPAKVDLNNNGSLLSCTNKSGERLKETLGDKINLYYCDYKKSTDILELLGQQNLDEYIQQFDDYALEKAQLDQLNYIVGKQYEECLVTEIDDADEVVPYFKIRAYGVNYDSLTMGMGEHSIFYLFWLLGKIEKNSILLIEEPETFLSINSQRNIMDYIAENVSKMGITVILTTHSPFIIKRLPKENVCVVSRNIVGVGVYSPAVDINVLNLLGMESKKKGIIYVEDVIAECFLKTILSRHCDYIMQDYNIECVDGESHITERLKFPRSSKFEYNLIGIYDGDMREKITQMSSQLNWKFCFLPSKLALEEEFRNLICNDIQRFMKIINIDRGKFSNILSRIEGQDHHDWFRNCSTLLGLEVNVMVDKLYDWWYERNIKQVEDFLKELLNADSPSK